MTRPRVAPHASTSFLPTEAQVEKARAQLARLGVYKPRPSRHLAPDAVQRLLVLLEADGYEPIPNGVRIPLARQAETLLAQREAMPLTEFRRALKGCSPQERTQGIRALAESRTLSLVLRGPVPTVCAPSLKVLSPLELRTLHQQGLQAGKAIVHAAGPCSLLRRDVDQALGHPQASHPLTESALLEAVNPLVQPRTGLCFVPELVATLAARHPLPRIHAALEQAARRECLELRPESGLGRLSPAELLLCPPGPRDTRLSWLRLKGTR